MKSYRVLKDAERDLDGIFEYWAERASIGAAERVIDAITERFWILGEHPEAGYACKDIGRGVRCFPAGDTWCITARDGAGWRFSTCSMGPGSGANRY